MDSSNKKLLIGTLIIGAVLGVLWFFFYSYLTIDKIQHIGKRASAFSSENPALVFVAIVLVQIVGMMLTLPTKAIFTVLAGALLGTALGSVATVLGVLVGTSVLFFSARHVFRERVAKKLKGRVKMIEEKISRRPIRAMIGIRLLIALPFGPCTISAALSSMRYRDFLIGTILGDLPVVVLYAFAGNRLFLLASTGDALSPTTVAILIVSGLVFIALAVFGKAPRRSDAQNGVGSSDHN